MGKVAIYIDEASGKVKEDRVIKNFIARCL